MGLKHPPQPSCPRERKVFGIRNQVALSKKKKKKAWKFNPSCLEGLSPRNNFLKEKGICNPYQVAQRTMFWAQVPQGWTMTTSTVCSLGSLDPKHGSLSKFGWVFHGQEPQSCVPKELGPKTWFIKQSSCQVPWATWLGLPLSPFSKRSCSQCK